MRTTSMARTTPAQNPRGFSSSRVFPSFFVTIPATVSALPNSLFGRLVFGTEIGIAGLIPLDAVLPHFPAYRVHEPRCGDGKRLSESTGMVNVSPTKMGN